MGLQIESGIGDGYIAAVDKENRLKTFSVTQSQDHHTNIESGKVWSLPFDNIINAAGDDYIFYITNTGTTNLELTDFRLSASAETQIEINEVTGTAGGAPATITPISRNLGSSNLPSATIVSDPDITGLSKVGTLFYMDLAVADTQYHLHTSSRIIIPKGSAVAILVETTTITISGVVSLVESGS